MSSDDSYHPSDSEFEVSKKTSVRRHEELMHQKDQLKFCDFKTP